MARRAWQSVVRRKAKGKSCLPDLAYLPPPEEDGDDVVLRRGAFGNVEKKPKEDASKRFTINLGVEDVQAPPRPESLSQFHTDDELDRRDSRCLKRYSTTDEDTESDDEISVFLIREYRRLEDAQRDKDFILQERRRSLVGDNRETSTCETDKRRRVSQRRDGMCQALPARIAALTHAQAMKENISATDMANRGDAFICLGEYEVRRQAMELSLGTPTIFAGPEQPDPSNPPVPPPRTRRRKVPILNSISPPGTPNTPSTSGIPFPMIEFNPLAYSPLTPYKTSSGEWSASPQTPGSPLTPPTPDTPDSITDQVFLLPDLFEQRPLRTRTLEHHAPLRSRETSKWPIRQSATDDMALSSSRRCELRRSVSEHVDITHNSKMPVNRTNSAGTPKTKKNYGSFRHRIMKTTVKDKPRSLPTRTFQRILSVRNRKKSGGDESDTGVGGGGQHGGRGSDTPSPQLPPSRPPTESPSKLNIFMKWKGKGGKGSKSSKSGAGESEGGSGGDGGSPSLSSHDHHHPSSPCPTTPLHHNTPASPFTPRLRAGENLDDTRRTENTLKIWVMEAKGIPSKKKYFCMLTVNETLYGRTYTKQKTDLCFWGEYFELNLLPQVTTMTVELMREGEKRGSRKRIGWVEIPMKPAPPSRPRPRPTLEERWYPVHPDKPERDAPSLRIKHKFQSLDILPLNQYSRLRAYLKDRSVSLCQLLEPAVCVKAKEEVATALVHIMQAEGRAVPFLADLVCADVHRIAENEHLLFRGNSIATKAVESYMKVVGEQYLHTTLREVVGELTSGGDLEVDPLRVANIQQLPAQRLALRERVTASWERILASGRNFPVELREMFQTLRVRLARDEKCELTDNLISSCVFLRFLCPAVLSPSLFSITKEFPDERSGRNLTLVAKILQTLANFTHFQGKENFMEFLNDFITKEQPRCRTFLADISRAPSEGDSTLEFDGKIDLGKHLALLHLHLADALVQINTQGCESEASQVLALVEDISAQLGSSGVVGAESGGGCSGASIPSPATPTSTHNNNNNNNHSNNNNNYRQEECGNVSVDGGGGVVGGLSPIPAHTTAHRSQSLPRSSGPVCPNQIKCMGSPGPNQLAHQERAGGPDVVGVVEDLVLTTTFDHQGTEPPHISMLPHHLETNNNLHHNLINNNNNNNPETRLSNGNTYYLAEVPDPSTPPPHPHLRSTQSHLPSRLHPQSRVAGRSHSLTEKRGGSGGVYQQEYSEFVHFMDSCTNKVHNVCLMDPHDNTAINTLTSNLQGFHDNMLRAPHLHSSHDNSLQGPHDGNIQGSQTSISQLSNMASSSGYHSFAYSQSSSSPVDSLLLQHAENSGSLISAHRDNGNTVGNISGGGGGVRHVLQGSPLASPLHQVSKHHHRPLHPSPLGHHHHHPSSLHNTPRHAPRLPQGKGSPNGSLSSCQSAEELRCLRRSRPRHRRRSHSSDSSDPSSDTSPDTRLPASRPSLYPRHSPDTSPDTRLHSSRPSVHPRLDTSSPLHSAYHRHPPPPRTNPHCSPRLSASPALRQQQQQSPRPRRDGSGRRGRAQRVCEGEEFGRGGGGDSEEDVSVCPGSPGGVWVGGQDGGGGGGRTVQHLPPHILPPGLPPTQILDQQEDQMRVIIERLVSMEHEFRVEQAVLRRAVEDKDARINAQARHIAALDSANTQLIRTIASLSSRPGGELKTDATTELQTDSCNASDTSDYKSSSC